MKNFMDNVFCKNNDNWKQEWSQIGVIRPTGVQSVDGSSDDYTEEEDEYLTESNN